ncbi:outer membrane lipoprotein-sorting protein [Nautilia lithotrophica]
MKKLLFAVLIPVFLLAGNILEEIDKNLNPTSFEAYKKLINIEPDGSKKEFLMWMIKKDKDKIANLFLKPKSDYGRALLRLGDNMWLYIPGIAKPLRVASAQSVTGGVFNNSDILRVDYAVEYDIEKQVGDTLYLKAKNEDVTYEKVVMKIDLKRKLPLRLDCYAGGILIKTIEYGKITDFGNGIVRPAVMQTTSPLQKGYKSIMIWAKIKPRKLKDEYFTLEFMPHLNEIRK